jgi:hypothetical protein
MRPRKQILGHLNLGAKWKSKGSTLILRRDEESCLVSRLYFSLVLLLNELVHECKNIYNLTEYSQLDSLHSFS